MATSNTLISQFHFFSYKTHSRKTQSQADSSISIACVSHDPMKTGRFTKLSMSSSLKLNNFAPWESKNDNHGRILHMPSISRVVVSSAAMNKTNDQKQKQTTFVEELRSVAMKLHVKNPSKKEGTNETMAQILMKEKPSLQGYVKFLVDSKVVYDALEKIIGNADNSFYAELRNTGLERSRALAKDLEWFREEVGIQIPSPTISGTSYASYLEEIAVENPKAIICHFYDIYFGLAAGGRMLGKRVQAYEKILENKELEFYKWNDGEVSELLLRAKAKLNKVAQSWTREEKDQCLEETEISFKYSEDIMKLIIS